MRKAEDTFLAVLSDGVIKLDGGSLFGQVPRVLWEQLLTPDRRNRVKLGLNCLLVWNDRHCVLIDTGVGSKEPDHLKDRYGLGTSQLARELRARGVAPAQVTAVVLTHLHFDHCGGCTRLNRSGVPVPAFPNATYYVQRAAWEEALNPNERSTASYHADDLMPLQKSGHLELLDGDTEVVPGVQVRVTHAHTQGHQAVLVTYGGERVLACGDLIPTPFHLRLPYIAAYDRCPEEVLAQKRALLEEAERNGWLLFFSHAPEECLGYVDRRNGERSFRPVAL
ncbi:MAG: MBL fold metallo-hydrolase [Chloroflexi bacterium]|nr:MBL fold metallo-hydrolase [Chloroflexota bacterium]